jgi:DNA modification methylase
MSRLLSAIETFYKYAKFDKPKVYKLKDGFVIHGDSLNPQTIQLIKKLAGGKIPLIVTDPPYGKIVTDSWDNPDLTQEGFASWLIEICETYAPLLLPGAAFYMWGGVGIPKYRPYLEFLSRVENESKYTIANIISWSKRRAYGGHNYLFTREELCYMIYNSKKPRRFNVPLLDKLRGYEGFNKRYPAKSPYLRRTNIWTDINELFVNKTHIAEKPIKLYEIPISVHTKKGDYVLDMFGGSGPCAVAARKLERKFIIVEKELKYIKVILNKLKE